MQVHETASHRYSFTGPPFVKWSALYYRSVVCPVLSVCNVGALWPNGWMDKMKLGMQVGFGPGYMVLDGDPVPPLQKGQQPLQFSGHICCGQRVACIKMPLGMEVRLSLRDIVLDGDPVPLGPQLGELGPQLVPNFWPMSVVAKRLD